MNDFLERISSLDPKRLALLAAQLQQRLETLEGQKSEPIAIIGMGCRFPGGADSPQAFWDLLRNGVDAIRETPPEKWDNQVLYDPDPEAPGRISTRWGGFLDNLDQFDPTFFGISPREAANLDPQQRLLLEVTWEALENAGHSPEKLMGSQTGVFVGISGSDYLQLLVNAGQANIDAYMASGNAHSIASGRLSYFLGTTGPSLSIDTACSSSLVAIHTAVQSLRNGECDLALAGGVNVILAPETSIALSKSQMLAADGRCKTFDARADGFVRGEGCGMIVLKRLSDALQNGDRILAVIRGTAVNQDGRSNGLTAPNGPSQEAVIRAALRNAGVQPEQISYVETHGTGTSLGDPIEVQALGSVLCQKRSTPLMLGSVKTNVGHLESAAGVAGLIKTVLALQHGEIPPHLHLQERNPYIPWEDYPAIEIPTRLTSWEVPGGKRLAGVSSFGFSGTNAHVILEEAPQIEKTPDADEPLYQILPLSARSETALKELAERYQHHLTQSDDALADINFTASTGRAHFHYRLAAVASSKGDLAEKLAAFVRGEKSAGLHSGRAGSRPPKVAFLFTGQGAQYSGMGRQLYETQPVFRAALDRCAELLQPHLDRPLADLLFDDREADRLNETLYTQPALFAIEYALADLWKSWGIVPSAVMGHSIGEFAAACAAGVFSLEAAVELVAARGRLMNSLPAGGRMAAVFASAEQLAPHLQSYAGRLSIAALNGPQNTVISGEGAALEQLVAGLERLGIRARYLTVSHAFHSPLMDPILPAFEQVAAGVKLQDPQVEIISNLTGLPAAPGEMTRPDYWSRHIRQPVQFAASIQMLYEQGYRVFVEIGPQPILLGMGRNCLPETDCTWLPSLRSGQDDQRQLLDSLAALYTLGVEIDWEGFYRPQAAQRRRVALPTYPFQRERYWFTPGAAAQFTAGAFVEHASEHPLLGWRLRAAAVQETIYENQISPESHPFLNDHLIQGEGLFPSPGYIEMACAAARREDPSGSFALTDLLIQEPLLLQTGQQRIVQLVLKPEQGGHSFGVYSRQGRDWHLHSSGKIIPLNSGTSKAPEKLEAIRARCSEEMEAAAVYDRLRALGLEFGPAFQGLTRVFRRDGEALGRVITPQVIEQAAQACDALHPAVLDACLHLMVAALPDAARGLEHPFLLIGVDRLVFHRRPEAAFWSHIQITSGDTLSNPNGKEVFTASMNLYDDAGDLLAEFSGMQMKRAVPGALSRFGLQSLRELLYDVRWEAQSGEEKPALALPLEQVRSQTQPEIIALGEEFRIDQYDTALPELDRVCAGFIVRAFEKLGFQLLPERRFSTGEAQEAMKIAPRFRRLLERMLQILAEDGVLERADTDWVVRRTPDYPDPVESAQDLLARYPDLEGELKMTLRCAQSLDGVLREQVDPLQLLFPGGSLEDSEKLYQESPSARFYNTLLARAISTLVADLPPGRKLRVLEVGAGTGGTTAHVLPALPPDRCEYVFTDISPLFTARAREKFSAFPFVEYRILDTSRDPAAQGLEGRQFDLIIAANVLHATPSIRESLANVQRLLAPGGLLALLEATRPQRFGDLTVGLTDGWWAFSDYDLRPDYALLTQVRWQQVLEESGFTEVTFFPGEGEPLLFDQQALILSRNPRQARKTAHTGSWLILQDGQGLGQELSAALEAEGARCWAAVPGNSFAVTGPRLFTLNPAEPQDFKQALAHMQAENKDLQGVIFLWALDALQEPGLSTAALEESQLTVTGGLLHLVQALEGTAWAELPSLLVVTRGAQAVADDEQTAAGETLHPLQAPVWGLGHVIALEHPELRCVRIDLDPEKPAAEQCADLAAEIWRTPSAEDQIAFRAGMRRVRRLAHTPIQDHTGQPFPLHPDASYLITGGLGGLGLEVARWMAERGAGHLVLLGRRAPSPTAQEAIRRIEQAGARVITLQADVSNLDQLAGALQEIESSLPPLRGVIHAAGVLDDGVLLQQNWERFRYVMAPKVTGAWNLHCLTQDRTLDFMIFFSSGASLVGSAGQGNHAAANAFLDMLAYYRTAQGLPTISINWGAWAEIGAAAERKMEAGTFSPQEGLQALEWGFHRDEHGLPRRIQYAVLSIDLERFQGQHPPLYANLQRRERQVKKPERGAQKTHEPGFLEQLQATPARQRSNFLTARVRELCSQVLGISPAAKIDPFLPLSDYGLDSLMAVDLRNRLGNLIEQTLPATLLFEYPTVKELSDFIAGRLPGFAAPEEQAPAQVKQAAGADESPSSIDDLSEDEIAALLVKKLSSINGRTQ